MNKHPINQSEIRHLQHRWAVLQSFLDVENDPAFSRSSGDSKEGRIYRGCKDGAIVTCRALCERFGLPLQNTGNWKRYEPFAPPFKTAIEGLLGSISMEECEAIWTVLATANKCVAHLDATIPDHPVDARCLRVAIDLTKRLMLRKLADANLPLGDFI